MDREKAFNKHKKTKTELPKTMDFKMDKNREKAEALTFLKTRIIEKLEFPVTALTTSTFNSNQDEITLDQFTNRSKDTQEDQESFHSDESYYDEREDFNLCCLTQD